jgi:rSAM/selenodomain-associated transferase 2
MTSPPTVSVIIPALNEESVLGDLLTCLQLQAPHEVIVVDGGSQDRTIALAQAAGAQVLITDPGRAKQMNSGAAAATGDILLFLHADTLLEAGALDALRAAAQNPALLGGNFDTHFGGDDWVARSFNWIYRARLPFGIFYGDSGIWVGRDFFLRTGGYRPWPIMEDYELARRLHLAGPLRFLPQKIYVSPRRWKNGGLLHALTVWVLIQAGYTLGVNPHRLAWMYKHIR